MTAPADMGAKGMGPDGPDDAVSQDDFDREPTADRFHNRAPLSPEVLAESLSEVRDSLVALEGRLGSVAAELAGKMDGAEQRTAANARRLALEVADMGEALARRVRTLEHRTPVPQSPQPPPPAPLVIARPIKPPPPRPRGRELALSLALAALLAAVLGGFWYWRQSAPAASPPAPVKPPVTTPPAVATPPAAATPPPVAPAPVQPAKHAWTKHPWSGAGHRPWRPPGATGSASQNPASPANPTGYGAYHGPN